MLLTEYNEAEAMEMFKEEGMKLAMTLSKKLLDLGRKDDVARVSVDPAYRDKLILHYTISSFTQSVLCFQIHSPNGMHLFRIFYLCLVRFSCCTSS